MNDELTHYVVELVDAHHEGDLCADDRYSEVFVYCGSFGRCPAREDEPSWSQSWNHRNTPIPFANSKNAKFFTRFVMLLKIKGLQRMNTHCT